MTDGDPTITSAKIEQDAAAAVEAAIRDGADVNRRALLWQVCHWNAISVLECSSLVR